MGYEITAEIIIEEYLNNWFTYEELSQYLCCDIGFVTEVLENVEDIKLQSKVVHHKDLIDRYYNTDNDSIKISDEDKPIVEIADFMINNRASIRQVALALNIAKTSVHDKIHEKLPDIDIYRYKKVFDILMENKSFNTNNKQIIEQVLISYQLFVMGLSSQEICDKMGIGRNVLQRNLTTRLKKINKDKYQEVKETLRDRQLQGLNTTKGK